MADTGPEMRSWRSSRGCDNADNAYTAVGEINVLGSERGILRLSAYPVNYIATKITRPK